jgi:hypothetical protein
MKKIFLFAFLLSAFVGFAQSPVTKTSACNVCTSQDFTSISQLRDVKPTDLFFTDLQSLVERYGINVAACNATTFGGEQILTNAMAVQMINTSLQLLNELKQASVDGLEPTKKANALAKLKYTSFDLYKHKYKTVSKIKDLKASDCYYKDVQSLIENFSVDVTNKKGLLQANLPANGKNLALLLKQVLTLKTWDITSYNKEKISKGEFSTILNTALDKYNELIAITLNP